MLAHHAGEHRRLGGDPVGEHRGVVGVVEHGPGVVAHAAVHGHVAALHPGAHGDGLDGAHGVDRAPGGPGDVAPGLEREVRGGQLGGLQRLGEQAREVPRDVGDLTGGVRGRVRHAVPAAQVDLGQRQPPAPCHGLPQRQHPLGRLREALGGEDLGADVAVQPPQLQCVVLREARGRGLQGGRVLPVGGGVQREPELLVLVRGGDELVRGRVHPRGHAQHHGSAGSPLPGERGQQLDLREGVHHDAAHTGVESGRELLGGLVVAVQRNPLPGDPRGERHGQFPAGGGVDAETLRHGPAGHGRAEQGLGGVVDGHLHPEGFQGGVERLADPAGPGAERALRDHIRRGTVASCELRDRDPVHGHGPGGVPRVLPGEHRRVQFRGVMRHPQPRGGQRVAGHGVLTHRLTSSRARRRPAGPARWPAPGARRR